MGLGFKVSGLGFRVEVYDYSEPQKVGTSI